MQDVTVDIVQERGGSVPNSATPRPLAEFSTEPVRLVEGADGSQPKLAGVVAQVNVINRNHRYYSREVFEAAIEKVQDQVVNGEFTGELDHPDTSVTGTLEKTAFVFDQLSLEGDLVTFEARLLNTPAGATLKGLLEGGVRVGMSTRGTASIEWKEPEEGEDGPPVAMIQEDFTLYGVDSVKVPSNEAGLIRLRESVEARINDQSQNRGKETTVKITTVEELREQFPELVQEVEEAAKSGIDELQEELDTTKERVEALTAELEAAQSALETAKSAQEQLASLRAQLLGEDDEESAEPQSEADLSIAIEALRETVEELKSERDAANSERERLERENGLKTAFEELVSESKFAAILRDEIDPTEFVSEEALKTEIGRLEKLAKRVTGVVGTGKGKADNADTPVDETDDNQNPYVTERAKRLAGIGEG